MYKHLKSSMDKMSHSNIHYWTGKDISINIKSEITMNTTSVGTSTNQRNWVPHLGLHHFNPPSLDSKLTSKGKAWQEHKSAPRDKGIQTQAQVLATMVYSSLALNSSCLQCIQMVPYIALQWGNEGSNLSDLKAYGRLGDKWFGSTSRKTPKEFGLLHTSRCMRF